MRSPDANSCVATPSSLPRLPLLGDVEHHDHPITVLVHIQELSIQGQFRLRLGTGRKRCQDHVPSKVPVVDLQSPGKG
jgi:hypothetical protein